MAIKGQGSCLCGGVQYRVMGAMRDVLPCHCSQCRKTTGSYAMASACKDEDLIFLTDETLTWYQSSEKAKRGFCARCGGNLFWKHSEKPTISLMAGCLDMPTDLGLLEPIHYEERSDFLDCVKKYL